MNLVYYEHGLGWKKQCGVGKHIWNSLILKICTKLFREYANKENWYYKGLNSFRVDSTEHLLFFNKPAGTEIPSSSSLLNLYIFLQETLTLDFIQLYIINIWVGYFFLYKFFWEVVDVWDYAWDPWQEYVLYEVVRYVKLPSSVGNRGKLSEVLGSATNLKEDGNLSVGTLIMAHNVPWLAVFSL